VLVPLCDQRRAELQHDAMALGERFFQDRPKEFNRRLKGYWKSWQCPVQEATTKPQPI
jgi:hypothetical protein